MGQNNSTPLVGRRRSIRNALRSPFPRRARIGQGSLSATFYYPDNDLKVEQLNMNTATEEELMTLPGVTRTIAQNIVEHRQVIGRFNKIEDLALVSGVGAEKLDQIRPEICVKQRNTSCTSSRAPSMDSLESEESRPPPPLPVTTPLTDLNTASVFTLMSVRGINQELAANIVDHRERRGPFINFDDLLKVKGMNQYRLSAIRPYLCVGPPPQSSQPVNINSTINNNSVAVKNGSIIPRTLSVLNSRFTDRKANVNGLVHVKDIFEVLSSYSPRPVSDDTFTNMRDGQPALRVASWNLYGMSIEKADNPGIREVFCRTILENRFSLLAVQELGDVLALEKLCSELNEPKLRRVMEWRGERGHWKWTYIPSTATSCHGLGFLYDSQTGLQLTKTQIEEDSKGLVAVVAEFRIGSSSVSILNAHVLEDCELHLNKMLQSGHPAILLGDFSPLPDADFSADGYTRVLPAPTITNSIPTGKINFADNIFLQKSIITRYTGVSGVVRQGLTHLGIPRGWSWGGPASEHCPVWCELYS
ncbi:endonuclease/exonuclease/phosphatase family domain-containing protein 1-like [Lycorma delicatula]|uniref:endonuclease/exonuclease/phosphatase family domain-containing protein 1-like n=1 Tax=Lycorma delicatula TaxID=130591 RepID=UPI003F518064